MCKTRSIISIAAVIINLIRLGKYLESRAKGHTSDAIKKMLGLQAKRARALRSFYANMGVLIAVGSSVVYFYFTPITCWQPAQWPLDPCSL